MQPVFMPQQGAAQWLDDLLLNQLLEGAIYYLA